ncbi:MAG TPA: hypothetical protein DCX07_16030, partial [Phycisphaerales bacterium]|nr:hypothetical protein [Phycisphaerales bacterium]
AWAAWRGLVVPLRVPMDDDEMALLAENRFRQLGDRLVSVLQYSRGAARCEEGVSEAMIRATAERANRIAAPLDFRAIVERRGLWQSVRIALASAMLMAGLSVWQYRLVRPWFLRTFALAEVDYPQDTYLSVRSGPDFHVVRGSDLRVVVEASGQAPAEITVHFPGTGQSQQVRRADGGTRYELVFQSVAEPFEFYVTGGDDAQDRRRPHRVTVIDPPELEAVEFVVVFPRHMNRAEPQPVPSGSGLIPAPIGSTVQVWGRANKALRSAEILLDGKPLHHMRVVPAGKAKEEQSLRGLTGEFEIAGANAAATRTLEFSLVDAAGIANPRAGRYVVQVQPDREPAVEAQKRGVGAAIAPEAIVPLAIHVKDDCGIALLEVLLFKNDGREPFHRERVPDTPAGRRDVQTLCRVDLKDRGLAPGDSVSIQLRAVDNLPASLGGPNEALSGRVILRVVKSTDLMEDLVRRQQELRLEFLQTIGIEESARAKTAEAAKILELGSVVPDVRRKLKDSAIVQGTVGSQCAKTADTLEGILEEMRNNRLGSPRDHAQMAEGILTPLRNLGEPMDKTVAALNGTAAVEDPAALRQQAQAIERQQQALRERMERIAESMEKLESRQALANELEWVIRTSEELLKLIEKQSDQDIEGVFEGGGTTSRPARP